MTTLLPSGTRQGPAGPAAGSRPGPSRSPRRPGTARADAVLAIVALSVVVVLALWVAGRGGQDLSGGTGALLTSLGRLTGLVAADLLLVQVLAMARIPWAEQAFGQDRLARWHRVLGFSSFSLMLAHIVLVTLGYAASAQTGVLGELWSMIWTYPGMLLATAGTGLLVMVVVTSVRVARRALRYESWHLLHLYAYLGVGLALPHQIWTGTDFVSSPWARAYWWTLYVAALAGVLVYRVGLPLVRTLRHRVVVSAVVEEAPGIVSLHLAGRALDRLPVRAGQFFVWRFLDGPGWSRGHPYSLSAPPHRSMLRITVKDLGDGSRSLAEVKPGTRVLVEGPYGALTAARRTRSSATLMASGIGITPLRALLEEMPAGTTLLYRAREESDLALRSEIDALAAAHGHRVAYLLGPRASDTSWLPRSWAHVDDAAALRHLVPDIAGQDVFVCGPEAWSEAAVTALTRAGVPGPQIHLERFTY